MVPVKIGDLVIQPVEEFVYEYEGMHVVQGDFTRYKPLAVTDVDNNGTPVECLDPNGGYVDPEGPLFVVPRERLTVPAELVVSVLADNYNNEAHLQQALQPYIDCSCQKRYIQGRRQRVEDAVLMALALGMCIFALTIDQHLRWKPLFHILQLFGYDG